jgi:hypothetical protein
MNSSRIITSPPLPEIQEDEEVDELIDRLIKKESLSENDLHEELRYIKKGMNNNDELDLSRLTKLEEF